ncbi:hypothetical protein HYU92_02755 [Candidatus Curtissbacteria bacterium]|nr:hypothetical protein [Candidatus Curtissbacteria bacterium]
MSFFSNYFNLPKDPANALLIILLTIWALSIKGIAMWYAATARQKYWFVALLVVNSLGILEILYLFVFATPRLNLKTLLKRH